MGDKKEYTLGWDCPVCNSNHKKEHFAFAGQVDESKPADWKGRVKFDREDKTCGVSKGAGDVPEKYGMNSTGPRFDEKGYPQPLFCPHCGYLQKCIILVKTK